MYVTHVALGAEDTESPEVCQGLQLKTILFVTVAAINSSKRSRKFKRKLSLVRFFQHPEFGQILALRDAEKSGHSSIFS